MKKKGSDFLVVRVWFCLKPFSSSGDTPLKMSIKNRAEEPCVVTGAYHPGTLHPLEESTGNSTSRKLFKALRDF